MTLTLDSIRASVPAPVVLHSRPEARPVEPLPVPMALHRALRCLDTWGARVDADALIQAAGDADALQHAVRVLAAELNRLRGIDLDAQDGAELIELPWCGATTLVEFEFEPDASAGQACLLSVLVNGHWCDAEEVATAEQLTEWREAIGREFERRNEVAVADEREAVFHG